LPLDCHSLVAFPLSFGLAITPAIHFRFLLLLPGLGGELLILVFSVSVGLFLGDAACAGEHIAFVEGQEGFKPFHPVVQKHLLVPAGLILGEVQPHRDYAVEFADFRSGRYSWQQ
jgi:hypothetical protein